MSDRGFLTVNPGHPAGSQANAHRLAAIGALGQTLDRAVNQSDLLKSGMRPSSTSRSHSSNSGQPMAQVPKSAMY
jgi:hypothetical protein